MPKLIIIFLVTFLLAACQASDPGTSNNLVIPTNMPTKTQSDSSSPLSQVVVTLKTKYGPIAIKLYQEEAPQTVANFLAKSNSGFYNNLTFHRVEPGFVVQGGDPKGNGTGGGIITSEINTIPFKTGSVGLARGGIKEQSNDSQFFICLADSSCGHLTGEYVNFGEVVSGMEFVNQIQVGDKIEELTSYTK